MRRGCLTGEVKRELSGEEEGATNGLWDFVTDCAVHAELIHQGLPIYLNYRVTTYWTERCFTHLSTSHPVSPTE